MFNNILFLHSLLISAKQIITSTYRNFCILSGCPDINPGKCDHLIFDVSSLPSHHIVSLVEILVLPIVLSNV